MSRDAVITMRVSPEEREAFRAAAHEASLDLSQWLRLVAIAATGDRTLREQLRRAQQAG